MPKDDTQAAFNGSHFTIGKPCQRAFADTCPIQRARLVADEQWHPAQQGKVLKNGGYEPRIPYSDPRELIMDILKYGPEVEVLKSKKLRDAAAARLNEAAAQYKK